MKEVKISLLGGFHVTLDGQPVSAFESDKARALLAYLAVEFDRPHRREALGELLWPGLPEGAARRNLRHTLFRLREALCDRDSCALILVANNQNVQVEAGNGLWLDAAEFTSLLDECHYHLHTSSVCPQCLTRQQRAMELYKGDFLQGFSLPDSQTFTEWVVFKQEELHRRAVETLQTLSSYYERAGDFDRVRLYAHRQIELEPWREEAHRQEMLALALTGQREAALRQFEACKQALASELDLAPSVATVKLYESIRTGKIGPQEGPVSPAYTERALVSLNDAARPLQRFVARAKELDRLNSDLERSLEGDGHVVFVAGEAGSGKSALVQQFARQAGKQHPGLLVSCGRCTSLMGMGDPYEPFREALLILSGDMDALVANGTLTPEDADRVIACLPATVQAVVEMAPQLIDRMLPGGPLLARTEGTQPGALPWLARLRSLVRANTRRVEYLGTGATAGGGAGLSLGGSAGEPVGAGQALPPFDAADAMGGMPGAMPMPVSVPVQAGGAQPDLFAGVTNTLRSVAKKQPLLLILEDMQWADKSTAGMLFYLARHLRGSRVLVVVTCRPTDLLPHAEAGGNPLEAVVRELAMQFGDVRIDLDTADGRQLINELLDSEPNDLGEEFRRTLYRHTRGHPLFTVELLRGLQARDDLVKNDSGRWVANPGINWDRMPPRIEAAIADRISLLSPQSQMLLEAASVEGNVFTFEVLVAHPGVEPTAAKRDLSNDLCKRQRIVQPAGVARIGAAGVMLSRYRFAHELYRKYVYANIEPMERARLHREVAEALEAIFGANAGDIAAQLAHHFERAGMSAKAAEHLLQLGNHAAQVCAWEPAMAAYTRAINLLHTAPSGPERKRLEARLQLALADTMLSAAGWGGIEGIEAAGEMVAGNEARSTMNPTAATAAGPAGRADEEEDGDGETIGAEPGLVGRPTFFFTGRPQSSDGLQERTADMARAHFAQGLSKLMLGQFTEAREHLVQVVVLHRRLEQHYENENGAEGAANVDPHTNTIALTHILLAQVLWALGYQEHATEHVELAKACARAGRDALAEGIVVMMAGYVSFLLHEDRQQAQRHAGDLTRLVQQHGLHVLEPWSEILRGWASVMQGDIEPGTREIERGVAGWQGWGSRLARPVQLLILAEAYARGGRAEDALRQVEEAERTMEEVGGRFLEAEMHRLKGEMLLHALGREREQSERGREAETCFLRAVDVARGQQARSWELRAAVSLARLWRTQDRERDAYNTLQRAVRSFTDSPAGSDLVDARLLLASLSAALGTEKPNTQSPVA